MRILVIFLGYGGPLACFRFLHVMRGRVQLYRLLSLASYDLIRPMLID